MKCPHYRCHTRTRSGYCRKHAAEKPCLICSRRKACRRGVCRLCYQHAQAEIRAGRVTDAELVEKRLLLKKYVSYEREEALTKRLQDPIQESVPS